MHEVDVLTPYREADAAWLSTAVHSILNQNDVSVTLHLINDGCSPPNDPARLYAAVPNVKRYRNRHPGVGPYVSANRVFHHQQTKWLAIQDADDIAMPNRLIESIETAIEHSADYVSGDMVQFVDWGQRANDMLNQRRKARPILKAGRKNNSAPWGEIINGTLLVRRETFAQINGYANWPCGADTELGNRLPASGATGFYLPSVLGLRRLHASSLFHGGNHGWGTAHRKQRILKVRKILADYAAAGCDYRSYGDLDAENGSPDLEIVR